MNIILVSALRRKNGLSVNISPYERTQCKHPLMTTGKRLLQRVAPYAIMLKGLAHPYRISIVYLLAHEPMWGEDLARDLKIGENLLMHHLHAMEKAGWITKKQDGRHKLYSLRAKTFRELPKLLSETPFWKTLIDKKSARG